MKRLIIVFLTLMALSAPLMANTHITILGTSDLHGNIWGFSYEDSKETANNGMARVYTYVEEVRKENPNTILIDAGDDIQGTIMTDDIYNKLLSYEKESLKRSDTTSQQRLIWLGQFLFVGIFMGALFIFLELFRRDYFANRRSLLLLISL